MTTFRYSRSPRYNQLKRKALEIFARQGGWLTPPEWAVLAGFYPIRSAYSYLLRLHRFGLLERRSASLSLFRHRVLVGWWHTIRRRSQKHRINWTRMLDLAQRWLPQPAVLHPFPDARFASTHPR